MRDVIKVDNFLKACWRPSDRYTGSDATCRQEGLLWYKDIGLTSEQQSMSVDDIQRAFRATKEGFLSIVARQWTVKPQLAAVGSCCLVGVISNEILYIANAGDSRAVLGRAVKATREVIAIQLSTEHNASIESASR
ncbi:putative protein-serine/threonine phosphatase [Helianthus anomalus]